MKKSILFFISAILCGSVMFVQCTGKGGGKSRSVFSGKVVNGKGAPLDSVKITLQGDSVTTDKDGKFSISGKEDSRYVLNASRSKYGFVSKIFTQAKEDITITLARAKEFKIDLRTIEGEVIRIVDRNPEMETPPRSSVSESNPLANVPFVYDLNGNLIDFQMPAVLENKYDGINNFKPPVMGAEVEIPKKGLELNGDNMILDVSIQTIDIYSADGMPGDNRVRLGDCTGYIKSFGAMNFELSQNGKPVKLKKGMKAIIRIPVDTISILTKEPISETIPFLSYNKTSGLWEEEGNAILNKARSAYEGLTTHFSTFNMDMAFGTSAACYKICNTASTATRIEISAPYFHQFNLAAYPSCGTLGNCPAGSLGAYAISNMGAFSPVGIKMFNGTTLLSTYVFIGGDAVAAPNCAMDAYDGCSGPVVVRDTVATNFVKIDKSGMCNIELAFPTRQVGGSAVPTPIRLAWLFDDDFVNAAPKVFDVETSPNGNDTWTIVPGCANYASSEELIHHIDPPNPFPEGRYYFRIIRKVSGSAFGNPSNVVSIDIDGILGAVTPNVREHYPPTCM